MNTQHTQLRLVRRRNGACPCVSRDQERAVRAEREQVPGKTAQADRDRSADDELPALEDGTQQFPVVGICLFDQGRRGVVHDWTPRGTSAPEESTSDRFSVSGEVRLLVVLGDRV